MNAVLSDALYHSDKRECRESVTKAEIAKRMEAELVLYHQIYVNDEPIGKLTKGSTLADIRIFACTHMHILA